MMLAVSPVVSLQRDAGPQRTAQSLKDFASPPLWQKPFPVPVEGSELVGGGFVGEGPASSAVCGRLLAPHLHTASERERNGELQPAHAAYRSVVRVRDDLTGPTRASTDMPHAARVRRTSAHWSGVARG